MTLHGTIAILYRCRECNEPLNDDNWNKSTKLIKSKICNECAYIYHTNWRKDNPRYYNEYSKLWQRKNPHYAKSWKMKNPNYQKDWQAKYRSKNLVLVRANNWRHVQKWRKLHPDEYQAEQSRHRQKKWYCFIKNSFSVKTASHHLNKWLGLHIPIISHSRNGHSSNIERLEPLLELWYPEFMEMFYLFRDIGLVNPDISINIGEKQNENNNSRKTNFTYKETT